MYWPPDLGLEVLEDIETASGPVAENAGEEVDEFIIHAFPLAHLPKRPDNLAEALLFALTRRRRR
eukprot:7877677-Pyramimonas_sp.AAC.1